MNFSLRNQIQYELFSTKPNSVSTIFYKTKLNMNMSAQNLFDLRFFSLSNISPCVWKFCYSQLNNIKHKLHKLISRTSSQHKRKERFAVWNVINIRNMIYTNEQHHSSIMSEKKQIKKTCHQFLFHLLI